MAGHGHGPGHHGYGHRSHRKIPQFLKGKTGYDLILQDPTTPMDMVLKAGLEYAKEAIRYGGKPYKGKGSVYAGAVDLAKHLEGTPFGNADNYIMAAEIYQLLGDKKSYQRVLKRIPGKGSNENLAKLRTAIEKAYRK